VHVGGGPSESDEQIGTIRDVALYGRRCFYQLSGRITERVDALGRPLGIGANRDQRWLAGSGTKSRIDESTGTEEEATSPFLSLGEECFHGALLDGLE
jgi:hypothetical protein